MPSVYGADDIPSGLAAAGRISLIHWAGLIASVTLKPAADRAESGRRMANQFVRVHIKYAYMFAEIDRDDGASIATTKEEV
jgi:hypothetical protein